MKAAGQVLPLRSAREKTLLAALAYELGRPLSHTTLTDRIWDDPASANPSNLYSCASRLRSALRRAAELAGPSATGATLVSGAQSYALESDPAEVDWQQYLRLAGRARTHAEAGDGERALRAFHDAEELWRGEPLTGLPGNWAESTRSAMLRRRLSVRLGRFSLELALGRFSDLVPDLSAELEQYPTHEALAEHLLVAFYGSGRQSDALSLFRQVRRRLRADLGVEPGPRLTLLHDRILQQVPVNDLLPNPGHSTQSGSPLGGTVPSNLPSRSHLVGRGSDLARLSERLDGNLALQTLSGMAGVGKTELALHLAERLRPRFPDAQIYHCMRAHSPGQPPASAHSALVTLLRRLGTPAGSLPNETSELSALWRTELSRRRVLVLLDDVASPEQVRPLLPESASSVVLLTSRHRLSGLPGVHTYFVDLLPPDEAAALFRHLVGPERADDDEVLGHLVAQLGHLPLAIEIAASRLKDHPTWSLGHLSRRLSRTPGRLGEIRHEFRDVAKIFELSYLLLTSDQKSAFRRLGLHPAGEFDLYEGAALMGLPLDTAERILENLLDYHLITELSPDRFRMHDLLAEYSKLLADAEEKPSEREAARRRLIHCQLRLADRADRLVYPGRPRLPLPSAVNSTPEPHWTDEAEARKWLVETRTSLLSVERHARLTGLTNEAARLAHVLAEHLGQEGHWQDAVEMHTAAVEHWRSVNDRTAEARALIDLSGSHARSSRYVQAAESGESALELTRAVRDVDGQAEALAQLALLHWHVGEYEAALTLQRQGLSLPVSRHNRVRYSNNLGIILLYSSDHPSALAAFFESLTEVRQIGDLQREIGILNNIGEVHLAMDDRASARRTFEEALALNAIVGSEVDRAALRINLADSVDDPEDLPRALALCEMGLETYRQLGDRRNQANALNARGDIHLRSGSPRPALDSFTAAQGIARDIGAPYERSTALRGAGRAAALLGLLPLAEQHLRKAIRTARSIPHAGDEAAAADVLAAVLLRLDRATEAREVWRRAVALGASLDLSASEYLRTRLQGE
ncbi:BTAD domain-containing putative transcriptional regulator [Kitasatospora sp. NPDC051853]|uniref:AfsR/SARP family transcriptional regulator n=1 Tax=Kitasatospora sp. NPDC051853 TaxID=3364058 RepID=UPI003797BB41